MYFKKKKKVISFLVSGNGSNFKAVAEKIISGYIYGVNGIVISSSSTALALKKAEDLGIKCIDIEPGKFKTKEEHESEIIRILKLNKTDLVVAAGYMRILTPEFINHFRYKIINIHPSLLPSFPGKNAQQQALHYGVRIAGCTTHFIDEGTDTGPIIMQVPVEVLQNDTITTLSTKIIKEEHKILIESVKLFCDDQLVIDKNKVIMKK